MAIRLNAKLAESHSSLGYAATRYDWDWEDADKEFRIAIGLNPKYATAHQWYAEYLVAMGRFEEASAEFQRAADLEPFSLIINAEMAMPYEYAKQFDEAIALNRKAVDLESNFPFTHSNLGWDYVGKQMYEEALKEYQKALDLSGGKTPMYLAGFSWASALAGRKGEAVRALEDLKALSKTRYVSSYQLALVHVGLGDPDQALQSLEHAYEKRDEELMFLKVDWSFDTLRSTPRFQTLLKKMKFPK